MAINLAEKYSAKVDERFKLGSIIAGLTNQDYDWDGVNTIKVYSINTVATGAYTRSGANRYGTPAELQDTVTPYQITQDRAFTFTIDKGNDMEQLGVKNAGKALARQIDEVLIPEHDKYVLGKMAAGAGNSFVQPVTTSNAYETILSAHEALSEDKAPLAGRIIVAPYSFLTKIKQDASFVKQADLGQQIALTGQVGTVDGAPLVLAPAAYFPTDVELMLVHPVATVAPVKLNEYKLHLDPPGISGALVEGRTIYDAFVLANKADAICVVKSK